ncbi:MAG: MATE family efflux transporter [Bacteroidia bacterium]
MKIEVSYSQIWKISWPIMLSSMANTVINFTDVAFVSRVGEIELAASALGGVFYFLMVMISTGIGIGSQILIARNAGEGRKQAIGSVFDNGFLVMMAITLIMLALLFLFIPYLLPAIIRNDQVASSVLTYLFARGLGLLPMGVLVSLRSFYTGITLTRIISYTTLTMMLSNLVLNYALVFGHFGFPALGLEGAGLASAIAELLAAVYAVVYSFYHHEIKEFRLFRFEAISKSEIKNVLQISSPIVLQNLLSMGSWFLFFILIEKIGERELAVSNVVRSVYMVLMTPIWGFSQTANSMVSNLIGQKRDNEVLVLVRKIAGMSLAIGTICIVFSLLFSKPLFLLSTSDLNLITESTGSFYVVCVGTFFFSLAMIYLSAVSGTGQTRAAMNIEIVCLMAYILYAVYFTIVSPSSLEIVWCAEALYWLMMGLISWFYLRSGKWRLLPSVGS